MGVALEHRPYGPPDQQGLRAWRSPSRGTVIESFSPSPPSNEIFAEVGDWEEIAPRREWDHDHCEFCWAKFEAAARVADLQPPDPSILTEGYVTVEGDGALKWICERCFEDFKDEFHWSAGTE